jgi:HEAT repeat protein
VLEFWSPRVRRLERKRDVAGILDVLSRGNLRARRAAANALIRLPDPRSADRLAEALADGDALPRSRSARSATPVRDARPRRSTRR